MSMVSYQVETFGRPLAQVVRDIPIPQGSEVVLKVGSCGVCHSDVHLHDGYFDLGNDVKLDMTRTVKPPRTLGHEIAGTVVAVGPDAQGVKVGDRRVVFPWIGCGTCSLCEAGHEHLCNSPQALGAGCTIILKGPEDAPSAVVALAKIFHDAGLPKGVLNTVWGVPAEVSEHLLSSPIVRKITFTGSTPVGKMLAAKAASQMKRCTMELGGHAPVIVCDDPDVDQALRNLVSFKFRNAGQVCISPTRFYVQEGVYERFVADFVSKAQALKVGDGLFEGTQMGPLAQQRRAAAVTSFVDDARERGASVLLGGAPLPGAGNFFAPTVIADLPDNARLLNEEPFGPVAGMIRFKTIEEVLQRANCLPYGLASYVFTQSNRNAHALSTGLAAGMVSINHLGLALAETPFGGIYDSGMGSEGGMETFDAYLNTKFVTQFN